MNELSSSNDNINKGCSQQELAYPSKFSIRTVSENAVQLTERQRRKIQQKENKEAAFAKKKARMNKVENRNHLTENSGGKENRPIPNPSKDSQKEKNKSRTKELKASVMNPKDPESSLSDDYDDIMVDESEEQEVDSSWYFQEVTQESKDLFSNIKSEGQLLKILSLPNSEEAPRGMYEFLGECGPVLEGYQPIGEIGHGAHGKVFKLRKDYEKDEVIKLYDKADEKQFLTEASILANLRRITAGGIGIRTFVKTRDFYGILMSAGIGTLGDFRDFLREEEVFLTEKELLAIHMGLMRNYAAMRTISVFHRDIKLGNIILHSKDLNLEIIDYSFAVYADSKRKYQGYVGTKGFKEPRIFYAEEEYGDERLLEGDLFSIGITVLCMADLKFELKQQSIRKRTRESLKRISSKKQLCKILKALIFDCKDITEKQAKSIYPKHSIGYFSSLSKHQDQFEAFLEKRQGQSQNIQDEMTEIPLPLNFQDPDCPFPKVKDFELEQKVSAYNYLQINENLKARDCYVLIIKNFIKSGLPNEAKPYFYEIYSDLFSGNSDFLSPLLYSTLGVYLHLAKGYEGARSIFELGLQQCKEKYETLILLNNYSYACDFTGHHEPRTFQKVYDIITNDPTSLKNIALFVQIWLKSFKKTEQRVAIIPHLERQYEIVLTAYQSLHRLESHSVKIVRPGQKSYSFSQSSASEVIHKCFEKDEELIFITYINYCKYKAGLLASKLEGENKELLEAIKQFCWSLNQEYFSQILFKPDFGVLGIILEFLDLLLRFEKEIFQFKELSEEVLLFEKFKTELYQLHDEQAQEEFFEKLLTSEFLIVLIGFIAKFSGEQPNNNFSKRGVSHIQKKAEMLLKITDVVEMSVPKMNSQTCPNLYFLLESLFDSDVKLNFQLEGLKLLGKTGWFVYKSKFKIQPGEHQWRLFHLTLSSSKHFIRTLKLPIFPKSKINVESLQLYVKQEEVFYQKEAILHEFLASQSVRKLDLEFNQGMDKNLRFDDKFAEQMIEVIYPMKQLESFRIKISDGHLTAQGIKCFEKMIKGLRNLKSLTMIFVSCPYITNPSVQSLIKTFDTFPQLEFLNLEFHICGSVSIEKIAEYKNEMKSHLKGTANILVQPIIDFSYMNTT